MDKRLLLRNSAWTATSLPNHACSYRLLLRHISLEALQALCLLGSWLILSVLDKLRDNTSNLGILRLDAVDYPRFSPVNSEDRYDSVRRFLEAKNLRELTITNFA